MGKRNYGSFFGGLAEGLNKNVDRYVNFKEKIAELELSKQKALEVERAKRSNELPQEALKFFGDYQKQVKGYKTLETGPDGKPLEKSYAGMDPKAAESYYAQGKKLYGDNLPDIAGTPGLGAAPKTIPPPNANGGAEARRNLQRLKAGFDTESKPFSASVTAYSNARTHAQQDSAVGDVQLVYDLIQSAQGKAQVSDADVRGFADQGGINDKAYAAFLRAKTGQKFPPNIKKQIMDSLEAAYKTQEAMHTQRENEYRRMSLKAEVDPEQVIHEFRPVEAAPDMNRISMLLSKPKLTPDETAELLKFQEYRNKQKKK